MVVLFLSIGGEEDLKTVTTLTSEWIQPGWNILFFMIILYVSMSVPIPSFLFYFLIDILRKFNPAVKGYSTSRAKAFNMAIAGAQASWVFCVCVCARVELRSVGVFTCLCTNDSHSLFPNSDIPAQVMSLIQTMNATVVFLFPFFLWNGIKKTLNIWKI